MGERLSSHIGISRAVHSDGRADVIPDSPKVAGVIQARAAGVDFNDKGVETAAMPRIESRLRRGKVPRQGRTGDVGGTRCVNGNAGADVPKPASQQGRIDQFASPAVDFGDKGVACIAGGHCVPEGPG